MDNIEAGSPVTDPLIFADFEFAVGSGPHPETGEPATMGLLRVIANGQVVTCVMCREMVEQMGAHFLEEAPNITFSAVIVDDIEKKQNVN